MRVRIGDRGRRIAFVCDREHPHGDGIGRKRQVRKSPDEAPRPKRLQLLVVARLGCHERAIQRSLFRRRAGHHVQQRNGARRRRRFAARIEMHLERVLVTREIDVRVLAERWQQQPAQYARLLEFATGRRPERVMADHDFPARVGAGERPLEPSADVALDVALRNHPRLDIDKVRVRDFGAIVIEQRLRHVVCGEQERGIDCEISTVPCAAGGLTR